MKMLFKGAVVASILTLALAGCGSPDDSGGITTQEETNAEITSQPEITDNDADIEGQPDGDSQQGEGEEPPEALAPGLSGEVVSVADSEITVKVIKAPGGENGAEGNEEGAPEGDGEQPGAVEYTGETLTVKTSADTQIESSAPTGELEITDIKAGDILQIFFSDEESLAVSKIVVTQPSI